VARQWGNIARKAAGPAGYWLVLALITFLGLKAVIKIESTGTRLFLVIVVFGAAFGAASLLEHLLRDYMPTDIQPNGEPTDIWPRWYSRNRPKSQSIRESVMARILLVGYDPETVDYSNPALPPGMSAEKIRAGIALMLKQMTDKGWESDLCFIRPDETAGQTVERHLASASYTCVVIGAGVRLPPQGLEVFEAVVNAVHRGAPGAAIAFNTRPEDSADAAARWMPHDPAHTK